MVGESRGNPGGGTAHARGSGGMPDIVEHASDPAFELDEALRVVAWNRRAEALFGRPAAQAVGWRCYEILRANLPGGEPLCGPDCHGGTCYRQAVPFGVAECVVAAEGAAPFRAALSSLILPAARAVPGRTRRVLVFVHPLDRPAAGAALPQPFRIHLLGPFAILRDEHPVALERWQRRAALVLVKLLAMRRGQPVHGDVLIEHLWPGAEAAAGRQRLKVAAYYARHELGSRTLIEHGDGGYALARGEFWLDVAAFEAHVAAGVRHARAGQDAEASAALGDALALYRGDFLEEHLYDDWCAEERERLRELYFDAAARLAAGLRRQGRLEEAERTCRRALAREACREAFHRQLMEVLIDMGRLPEADQQFRSCRAILLRELGVEPLPETRRVFDRVQAARTARS